MACRRLVAGLSSRLSARRDSSTSPAAAVLAIVPLEDSLAMVKRLRSAAAASWCYFRQINSAPQLVGASNWNGTSWPQR